MSTERTTCCYCGVGCVVRVTKDRRGDISVAGDPDYPVNRGMLCSKGRMLHQVINDQSDRLLYPQIRTDRTQVLARSSWDGALDLVAGKFRTAISEHGPDSVAFYVSGQFLTEEYYVANKLMKGFIGSNNIDTNSRLCMSSAATGYKLSLGDDACPVSYDDIEKCSCFLIAGANPAWCHPILYRRLEAHKLKNPDVKIIVADPRRTQSTAIADLHVQLQPGTDVVFFNALARVILERGWVNRDFIRNHIDDFSGFRDRIFRTSLEEAAKICRVPAADIVKTAEWIGTSPTFISMWAMGLNQSSVGTDKNLALINLSLLTGKIGKPGCGPFSLTGQPNAMGGREVGGMATMLAAHHNLASAEHREKVAKFWGGRSISAKPGLTATEIVDAIAAGQLKALWIMCTNPAVSLPDARRFEEVIGRCPFVVVQDISSRSATVRHADVVLPAAGWLEKQGTMTNSERRISYLPRLLEPPGEALPDSHILCRFAEKMGWGDSFNYADESEIFNEHARLTAGTVIDISGVNYERLRRAGSIQWPCTSPDQPGTVRLFENHRFFTASGRARLHGVMAESPAEPADDEFPFLLTTGRLRDQWHTMTKTGKVSNLLRHENVPFLEIHPVDAEKLGIRDGDTAEIANRRGVVHAAARVTDSIKPGVVFLPMHWGWTQNGDLGRANNLTAARVDARSKQPDFKFSAVRVKKIARARKKILIVGAGAAARHFIAAYRKLNREDEIHVFGREPHLFYNRIQLPDYIGGERDWDSLLTADDELLQSLDVHFHRGCEVAAIDREAKSISLKSGERMNYDRLILGTGSRAFVPPGTPADWQGVFTLRTREDADRIKEHMTPGTPTVIVGGGLLGLELAASLHRIGMPITILDLSPRLMGRQLDATGSELLREEMEERGMRVLLGDAVSGFIGGPRIEGIETKAGHRIDCRALFVAVGTRPNSELAAAAGLACKRGVVVNDHLQTSDPDIYALGEIAEHRGLLYGFTQGAVEQAEVAASHLAGRVWTTYPGSTMFNILKIHGLDVAAMGQADAPEGARDVDEIVFLDRTRRVYKKCLVRNNRLLGAVLIGDKSEFTELKRLMDERAELDGQRSELLMGSKSSPREPPVGRIVCSCNNVGVGNLENLVASGCTEFTELCSRSRAGTGCGSCRPEVLRLLEDLNVAQSAPA